MATPLQWAEGYARQAEADFELFQRLQTDATVSACHKLQFLQMACEKVVKAHLCRGGSNPSDLQTSHAYVATTLPIVLREAAVARNVTGPQARKVLSHARHLARQIELLAPAVKRGGQRPDNCEYPWEDAAGELHIPLDWAFSPASLLVAPTGRTFLKLLRAAIDRLLP